MEWQVCDDEREWQTCDNEVEWQTYQQDTGIITGVRSVAVLGSGWVVRHWRVGAALLVILMVGGGWAWHQAQRGLAQIEVELRASAELDLWSGVKTSHALQRPNSVDLADATPPVTSTVHLLALKGESAVVQIVMQPVSGQFALRQTRVYQRTELGWQQIAPTTALWGSPRRLQTKYFDFHYYAQDEEAVTAAAAIVDGFYSSLSTNFQSSMLASVRVQVDVDPTKTYGSIARRPNPEAPLVVASPATYLAPVELSEADLLAQSVVLSLLSESAAQAVEARWHPLLDGLFLWQLWEVDLPLTVWREPLVTWVFSESFPPRKDAFSVAPTFYSKLCAMHRQWMVSPLELQIPIDCRRLSWERNHLLTWGNSYKPPLTLARLAPLASAPLDLNIAHPSYTGSAVLLATVIDYIATTFGQEQIPLLVASLDDHVGWETLAPELFGVSANEFEAGWSSYVTEQYDVSFAAMKSFTYL